MFDHANQILIDLAEWMIKRGNDRALGYPKRSPIARIGEPSPATFDARAPQDMPHRLLVAQRAIDDAPRHLRDVFLVGYQITPGDLREPSGKAPRKITDSMRAELLQVSGTEYRTRRRGLLAWVGGYLKARAS